jgi:hypothetical protein
MLLFIIMNMSNSRVYFMRQNASAPAESQVCGNARSLVRASQCGLRPFRPVRAYYRVSTHIMYRPCHIICSPRPLPPVRARWRSVHAQSRSILAQSPSVRAYRNKSAPIRIPPSRTGRSPRPQVVVDTCLGPV